MYESIDSIEQDKNHNPITEPIRNKNTLDWSVGAHPGD